MSLLLRAAAARGALAAARPPRARPLCSARGADGPERPPGRRLMDFPPIFLPSIWHSVRNWIFANFIIRPNLDGDFDVRRFVDGSKQAVEVISRALSEGDFDALRDLVTAAAFDELRASVGGMSLAEREELLVAKEDIYLCFPYQIGLMFEEDERRWVEITMCYHAIKGLRELRETIGQGFQQETSFDQQSRVQVCNYRFIREYTKNAGDSQWIANVVNHYKPTELKAS